MKIKLTHDEVRALSTSHRYPLKDLITEKLDTKGRRIGAIAYRCDHTSPEGTAIYSGSVDNTRSGKVHGPGTEPQFFTDRAERDAYIEKRFDHIMAKHA